MVVELAVVNDPDAFVFIGNRLVTGLDVDDAQPPHGQADVGFYEKTIIIRAAMNDAPVHLGEHGAVGPPHPVGVKDSADSAHSYTPIRFASFAGRIDS